MRQQFKQHSRHCWIEGIEKKLKPNLIFGVGCSCNLQQQYRFISSSSELLSQNRISNNDNQSQNGRKNNRHPLKTPCISSSSSSVLSFHATPILNQQQYPAEMKSAATAKEEENESAETEVQEGDQDEGEIVSVIAEASEKSTTVDTTLTQFEEENQEDEIRDTKKDKLEEEVSSHGELLSPEMQTACSEMYQIISNCKVTESIERIKHLLGSVKNEQELVTVLSTGVLVHPLMHDVLNGHGFRVAVMNYLTSVCQRLSQPAIWFDVLETVRYLGFLVTRTFAASAMDMIRKSIHYRFEREGRNPKIMESVITQLRNLYAWCVSDRCPFDFVMYARMVFTLTSLVAIFDRQNLYRLQWPTEDVPRREGLVFDWVVGNARCHDFDYCVKHCDKFLDEMLKEIRTRTSADPPFSFMLRLSDYYFATDNFEKMVQVLEDCRALGVSVPEASCAKLMQLACAMNIPDMPKYFAEWRVFHPACTLSTSDIYRTLMYYGRAGAGKPCPHCGEPFNHRNVGRAVWEKSPPNHKNCPMLIQAQKHKGVLEDTKGYLPQNQDHSEIAFQLLEFSTAADFRWNPPEWRGFLLCCMFSPRALEAAAIVEQRFPVKKWDDFLKATFLRLYRHHCPHKGFGKVIEWLKELDHLSPIVFHEALMGVSDIPNELSPEAMKELENCVVFQKIKQKRMKMMMAKQTPPPPQQQQKEENEVMIFWGPIFREEAYQWLARYILKADIYIMPYTKRYLSANTEKWKKKEGLLADVEKNENAKSLKGGGKEEEQNQRSGGVSAAEEKVVKELCTSTPRTISQYDLKDSCSDFIPSTSKKHIIQYRPKESRRTS